MRTNSSPARVPALLVVLALAGASVGCGALFSAAKFKTTNIVSSDANYDALATAATAAGWASERGGRADWDLTVTTTDGDTVIFSQNVQTDTMGYLCKGLRGSDCKDAVNSLLGPALGLYIE